MRAGVAAGHPATADAGADVLADGGTAADAAVAACLASCVAETVMTGLLGGGHAVYLDAESGRVQNLDCFVAVPGVGAEPRHAELLELQVPFGAELVHYAVGPASCGVPGVPAGLEALWRRFGRLPWPRLCEPALELARAEVAMPRAHAACLEMLAPVMTMNEGAAIYAPGGRLLQTGDALRQPGLARAVEVLVEEGPRSVYRGTIAEALLAVVDDRGGLVTAEDLASYEALWSEPVACPYAGARVLTRAALRPLSEPLGRLSRLDGLGEPERALALVHAFAGDGVAPETHTTNVTVVDAAGSACVLTTSLGLGSGDFLPGLDLHLNSMLGETDLLRGELEPGDRMASMMAPSIVLEGDRPVLAAGAAGGTRLRSALVQVMAGVLDERLEPAAAVARPRLHVAGETVHLEPGFADDVPAAIEDAGFTVRAWPAPHHYFGGVSVITPSGGSGDPRRSGSARMLG